MKVVIVSAGKGERLRNAPHRKPLTEVAGKPLLQHVIETIITSLPASPENEIIIVTGWRRERIEDFLDDYSRTVPIKISSVQNHFWEKGNGTSVLAAAPKIEGQFLLLMADHIIEPSILCALLEAGLPDADLALAVDRKMQNPLVDLDDVTRVNCHEDRIIGIAKHLENYNAFDSGCFLCAPPFFDALRTAQEELGNFGISGGVQVLAEAGRASAIDIGKAQWVDVDTPEMLIKAEALLAIEEQ